MIEVGLLYGRQVELLNGEVVEMPPEGPLHAQLSTDAADYLRSLLGYNFRKKMGRLHKPINSFSIRHLISFGNASLTQKACPFFKVPSRGKKHLYVVQSQ
ncbi:hypothetical protein NIES267_42460 [Calothrix parasitica NIES-267]|uniref:Uncharacterized protein n=1 Tax=Calothrix parasitica NIES-267 TaxID=1973488 RepID=A0A1Z4LU23_9CYAN|nr:hypothetical protein NIES267_42460 [Calothrix parasitica NIES-267]